MSNKKKKLNAKFRALRTCLTLSFVGVIYTLEWLECRCSNIAESQTCQTRHSRICVPFIRTTVMGDYKGLGRAIWCCLLAACCDAIVTECCCCGCCCGADYSLDDGKGQTDNDSRRKDDNDNGVAKHRHNSEDSGVDTGGQAEKVVKDYFAYYEDCDYDVPAPTLMMADREDKDDNVDNDDNNSEEEKEEEDNETDTVIEDDGEEKEKEDYENVDADNDNDDSIDHGSQPSASSSILPQSSRDPPGQKFKM